MRAWLQDVVDSSGSSHKCSWCPCATSRQAGGQAGWPPTNASKCHTSFFPCQPFCCVLCVPVSTCRPYVQLRACSKPAQAAAYLGQNINNMQLVLLYYIKAGRQAGYLQTQNSVLLSKCWSLYCCCCALLQELQWCSMNTALRHGGCKMDGCNLSVQVSAMFTVSGLQACSVITSVSALNTYVACNRRLWLVVTQPGSLPVATHIRCRGKADKQLQPKHPSRTALQSETSSEPGGWFFFVCAGVLVGVRGYTCACMGGLVVERGGVQLYSQRKAVRLVLGSSVCAHVT
jgi:hypothetical protein